MSDPPSSIVNFPLFAYYTNRRVWLMILVCLFVFSLRFRRPQRPKPTSTGHRKCSWRRAVPSAWRARWTCTRRLPARWCGCTAPRWWTSTRPAAVEASAWKRRKPSREPPAGCWSPRPGCPTPETTRASRATPIRPRCSSTCSTVSSTYHCGPVYIMTRERILL